MLTFNKVKERVEKANDTEAANDTPEADIASPPKRIIANKDIHTPLRVAATPAHDRAINRINKAVSRSALLLIPT